MNSYDQWYTKQNIIPLIDPKKEPVGNNAKEYVLTSPFTQKVESLKRRIMELPHPESGCNKGLGNLGYNRIGRSTFNVASAGEIPTVSNGFPVG